jgi:SAM-dependent methyltransferase
MRRASSTVTVRCRIVAQSTFLEFARQHLPPPPARVLEIGCGHGELTTALAVDGYEPLGIDPLAPQGDRFRRVLLEDLDPDEGPFDAVVAVHSLHHMRHLDDNLDRVVALLRPGGVLVLNEFGWDAIDEPTLDWLWNQRRALAAASGGVAPATLEEMRAEWEAEHVGVHGFETLRAELEERFDERAFEPSPFLYRKLHGAATTEVLEQALIDAGAIQALGFRYAGVARPPHEAPRPRSSD